MPQIIDPRKILTGKDGELYDGDGNFLAEVNTFQAQLNISNNDYQPAGSAQTVKVMQNYSVGLTFTETVIQDARLLKKLVDALRAGEQVQLNFQGVLRGHNGTTGRYIFRSCVPDGSIDIINVSPGEVINRAWSFGVNEPPDIQALLA